MVDITQSARKHGIDDADILHALRHPLAVLRRDDDRILIIGPDRVGALLELVVLDVETAPCVIHAMNLRPSFYRHLER